MDMLDYTYTHEERALMLRLARSTLETITTGRALPELDLETFPAALRDIRACFVTLRDLGDGSLRGCTGVLVARCPLAEEIVMITEQTAFSDPRFPPVSAEEVPYLHIEISVLTPPAPLAFDSPDDLLGKLRPGVDGVTLRLGARRATFLPQVWERYPDPAVFLSLLARKMGCHPEAWRDPEAQADVYQAIVVEEPHTWN